MRIFHSGSLDRCARRPRPAEVLRRLLLGAESIKPAGMVGCGTVKGDLHDIGKNSVAMMLQSAGFRIVALGVDVPAERAVQGFKENQANVVALSPLLTMTMVTTKGIIEAIGAAGLREKVRVLVGGAPVTDTRAASIGACAYAKDAPAAVELPRKLVFN